MVAIIHLCTEIASYLIKKHVPNELLTRCAKIEFWYGFEQSRTHDTLMMGLSTGAWLTAVAGLLPEIHAFVRSAD